MVTFCPMGILFWPSDPTSRNISKETQVTDLKECKCPCVHCNVIYNSQDMEAAPVSTSRWVDKTTIGYYSAIKKEENFILCNSMDGPGKGYVKWN